MKKNNLTVNPYDMYWNHVSDELEKEFRKLGIKMANTQSNSALRPVKYGGKKKPRK